MKQYLDLLRRTAEDGVRQKNRTGIDTFMIPGAAMVFDCRKGFPILTTKEVNFKAITAELVGFLRGFTSAAQFRRVGTKIWDANANENKAWLDNPNRQGEDDLGRIYGVQWRRWRTRDGSDYPQEFDQLKHVVELLRKDPTSRRMIVSAWRPDELEEMALPPCHLLWQLLVEQDKRVLHMCMYQRSCDMFLGVPFNISSYALLLSLIAHATGYTPGNLTMFLADVHIYENHLTQVREQLSREPGKLPSLLLPSHINGSDPLTWLERFDHSAVSLVGYHPQPAIKAPMAV